MKKTWYKGALLPLACALIGCAALAVTLGGCANEVEQVYVDPEVKDNAVDSSKSNNKNIISFVIGGASGAIRDNEITVIVPSGTDVSKLKPAIVISNKAVVYPASDAENDFTNPTTYTVTAENGSSLNFIVTVIAPRDDGKNITGFSINGINGTIRDTAIGLVVPAGTNLASLSPVITVSGGASVSPASGAAANFTNPTTYTVTAENGTTKNYVVTVSAISLEYITVTGRPYIAEYQKGTELDLAGLVVTGTYSDNSARDVTAQAGISNYYKDVVGAQTVVVTVSGKTATFPVTVVYASSLDLTLGPIVAGNNDITLYGIPAGGIVLSRGADKDKPSRIVISAGGISGAIYDYIEWYIDGSYYSADNIITITNNYTYTVPHIIDIIAVKNGVWYSKTLTFTVVR